MKWLNEKTFFEVEKDRSSCHKCCKITAIISILYFLFAWVIYPIYNGLGVFLFLSSTYMIILTIGFVVKRDLLSVFIFLKSKEE